MEDEEDFTSPLDFASLSGMARQADVDVKTQIQKYRDLLAEGTRRMREQRIGPSSTERLLALAQALGSPTRTGKFGERMGLIAGTLGGQQRAQREAEIERADTLEKLGLKGAEFELGAAQTRANTLATLAARQQAAMAAAVKAGQPSYAYDQQGNLREVPARGTVHYPRTEEEFNRLPVGAYYRVPSGPEAGKIIPKRG
jgi:hypothetical protein